MQQNQILIEKQQFWLKHIESCKSLGLSRKEYCRQHGLVSDQMSYFASMIARKKTSPVSVNNFVKIEPLVLPRSITIRLSNGIAIEFPAANLTEVVKSLREIN
jgi:hypothetical protein